MLWRLAAKTNGMFIKLLLLFIHFQLKYCTIIWHTVTSVLSMYPILDTCFPNCESHTTDNFVLIVAIKFFVKSKRPELLCNKDMDRSALKNYFICTYFLLLLLFNSTLIRKVNIFEFAHENLKWTKTVVVILKIEVKNM